VDSPEIGVASLAVDATIRAASAWAPICAEWAEVVCPESAEWTYTGVFAPIALNSGKLVLRCHIFGFCGP